MISVARLWWPILLAVTVIQLGNGLSGTLFSLGIDARGLPSWQTGAILGVFYAGTIVGPLLAPLVIKRCAHVAASIAFAALAAISVAGLAVASDPWTLALLRLGQGTGYAGFFAVIESWLNLTTEDRRRARVFAVYILVQLAGLTAGQFFINARALGDTALFVFAALLVASPMLVIATSPLKNPQSPATKHISLGAVAWRAPLGAAFVVFAGYTWACVMATGPAFAQRIGLDDFGKSLFMALPIAAGALAQFPLAWIADHSSRRLVLAAMGAAAAAFAVAGAIADHGLPLFIAIAGFGAMTFPIYAVAAALTNESLDHAERIHASASIVLYFGIGAIAGPPIITAAMDAAGPGGFFLAQGAAALLLAMTALATLRRRRRRKPA